MSDEPLLTHYSSLTTHHLPHPWHHMPRLLNQVLWGQRLKIAALPGFQVDRPALAGRFFQRLQGAISQSDVLLHLEDVLERVDRLRLAIMAQGADGDDLLILCLLAVAQVGGRRRAGLAGDAD